MKRTTHTPPAVCNSPFGWRLGWGVGVGISFAIAAFAADTPSTSVATQGISRSVAQLDVGELDELSLVRERMIGESIAKTLYQDPDYIDDPILGDAIQSIWSDLLRSAREQHLLSAEMEQTYAWQLFLGRDKSFNAFALPGGYLGLHLGLIAATSSPDELASVLAHELSHVIQRHISRGQAQSNRTTPLLLAAMLMGAAASKKSDAVAQAAVVGASALGAQLQLNYSRDMEREADRLGFAILKGAGYAPQGFVSMFEKLQSAHRWSDDSSFPYLRTHPLNTERIASMQNRLQQEPTENVRSHTMSPLAYALIAARARAQSALPLEALQRWAIDAELPSFSQQTAEKRATALVVGSHYHEKSGHSAKAAQLMAQLQALVQTDSTARSIAQRLQADLALVQGQWNTAGQVLTELPKTRADTLLRAQAHLGAGQLMRASELLQVWVAQHPQDASAWQLLAQAHERQEQPLRHIRALAEAQLAQYDAPGALDRLQSARTSALHNKNQADQDVDLSIINSRITAIQSQINLNTP